MLTAETMPVGTGAHGLLLEVTSNSSVTSFTLCNPIVRYSLRLGVWKASHSTCRETKPLILASNKQSHSLASNKHYYLTGFTGLGLYSLS